MVSMYVVADTERLCNTQPSCARHSAFGALGHHRTVKQHSMGGTWRHEQVVAEVVVVPFDASSAVVSAAVRWTAGHSKVHPM
jgi:hypothetical protein